MSSETTVAVRSIFHTPAGIKEYVGEDPASAELMSQIAGAGSIGFALSVRRSSRLGKPGLDFYHVVSAQPPGGTMELAFGMAIDASGVLRIFDRTKGDALVRAYSPEAWVEVDAADINRLSD